MPIHSVVNPPVQPSPQVSDPVAIARTESALLTGIQNGVLLPGEIIGNISNRSEPFNLLLSDLSPNLGQNINTKS